MKQFNEEMNVAVMTTKFVLKENQPILFIYHHEDDGMWEFVGNQDAKDEDYMVVALEEIIAYDPTVQEVADLPLGGSAFRTNSRSPWEIE